MNDRILNAIGQWFGRGASALVFGAAMFALSFLAYTHAYRIGEVQYRDDFNQTMKLGTAGYDFSLTYAAASALRRGGDATVIYPPATVAAYIPATFFPKRAAYHAFSFALIAALFATVFLSLLATGLARRTAGLAALFATAALYHTYWFQFELERGNANTVAAALAAGGLLSLSRGRMTVAVLLLTAATQWRLYPGILAAFILMRGGLKPLLLFCAANAVAFFAFGPGHFNHFVSLLSNQGFTAAPLTHSLSYVLSASDLVGYLPLARVALVGSFVVAFALHWAVASWKGFFVSHPESAAFSTTEAALIGMAFQVMDLLPSISVDYKLGIQIVPFVLLAGAPIRGQDAPNALFYPVVAALAVSHGCLSAPGYLPKTPALIVNLILYAVLAFAGICREIRLKWDEPAGARA